MIYDMKCSGKLWYLQCSYLNNKRKKKNKKIKEKKKMIILLTQEDISKTAVK